MRIKMLSALFLAGAAVMSAQGYQDGVDYYNANYPEEAQIILDRTFNDPTTDKAVANYYLGQLAFDKGDMAKAAKYYNDGIAANAECPYNYIGLGAIALKQGNKSEAENDFKKAQNFNKKDAEVLTMIARVYYNTNPELYAKDIAKLLEKASKLNIKEPTIYILQADMVKKEDVGDAAGKYETAMGFDAEADKDGKVEIEHPEAYIKYAQLYEEINPQYGIERLKELLAIEPESAMAQRELAEAYYANRYYTPAAEQYGTYIKNPNSFRKDRQRYVGLLNFGKKYQESYDLAKQILTEDPGNFYMQRMMFLDQVDLKNYEQAVKDAEVFFANPAAQGNFLPNDYVQYGNALQALGQDSLALVQMAEAVKIAPEDRKADMLRSLSESQSKAKMYKEAAATQQQLVDMGTPTVNDLFNLARRYQDVAASSRDDEAERVAAAEKGITVIDECIAKVPDNFQLPYTKGMLMMLKELKVSPESTAAFEQTVNLIDQDPENKSRRLSTYKRCNTYIGDYYRAIKDNEKALAAYTKALEAAPGDENLQKLIDSLK